MGDTDMRAATEDNAMETEETTTPTMAKDTSSVSSEDMPSLAELQEKRVELAQRVEECRAAMNASYEVRWECQAAQPPLCACVCVCVHFDVWVQRSIV